MHGMDGGKPHIDFNPMRDVHDGLSRKLAPWGEAIDSVTKKLKGLPHQAADVAMNLDRGFSARRLTPEETRIVNRAWLREVDPDKVRIVNGPGLSEMAMLAFLKGNPAITIGNTIYVKASKYVPNMGLDELNAALLVHEYTHVIQWKRIGYVRFLARYSKDLCTHGFDPDAMYAFHQRRTTFAEESLEGQAEMVGLFTRCLYTRDAKMKENAARIVPRLKGSGAYGF